MYEPLKKQKSPKILADALLWIQQSLAEFGISGINIKELIEFVKLNLGNTNQGVRSNAITLFGQIRIFVGPEVRNFVLDVSPALLTVVDVELTRVSNESVPEILKTQKVLNEF